MIQTDRLSWLRKAFAYPPHVAARKLVIRIRSSVTDRNRRAYDLSTCTRVNQAASSIANSLVDIASLDCSGIEPATASYLAEMFLEHRYDLLGSGWVKNAYDSRAVGVEGHCYENNLQVENYDQNGDWLRNLLAPAHVINSSKIWRKISPPYQPIDWQKDYKSGYRWTAASWYKDQWVDLPGVDIKVPWELARLQHLPQLVLFAVVLPERRDELLRECRNQILDFIAANPPRMGVNWTCTMDVAIRAVNILLAYDICRQLDRDETCCDQAFSQIIADSIYEHGRHIVRNLEWSEQLANNHYLANLTGLLSIARYLTPTPEIDCWRAFAVQELISEMRRQFYPDGGNFESSTSYHRLSTEMMTYATAMTIGMNNSERESLVEHNPKLWTSRPPLKPAIDQEYDVNQPRLFPGWYLERLYRAGCLTMSLTRPSGDVAQIGDNDSGHLFRLTPVGCFFDTATALSKYENLKGQRYSEDKYWDRDDCCHLPLLSAMAGLFENPDLTSMGIECPLERSLISTLAGGAIVSGMAYSRVIPSIAGQFEYQSLPHKNKTTHTLASQAEQTLTDGLMFHAFPDSGIFIFRSHRLHLTICATPPGQNGVGGHSHNDKLSYDLFFDGAKLVADPGTYLYTALPQRRNEFRSVRAHNTIMIDNREQNRWRPGRGGLFATTDDTACDVLEISDRSITLRAKYRNVVHVRTFEISEKDITIVDYCNRPFTVNSGDFEFHSAGYGKLERRT